jgi:hypothetical protein
MSLVLLPVVFINVALLIAISCISCDSMSLHMYIHNCSASHVRDTSCGILYLELSIMIAVKGSVI